MTWVWFSWETFEDSDGSGSPLHIISRKWVVSFRKTDRWGCTDRSCIYCRLVHFKSDTSRLTASGRCATSIRNLECELTLHNFKKKGLKKWNSLGRQKNRKRRGDSQRLTLSRAEYSLHPATTSLGVPTGVSLRLLLLSTIFLRPRAPSQKPKNVRLRRILAVCSGVNQWSYRRLIPPSRSQPNNWWELPCLLWWRPVVPYKYSFTVSFKRRLGLFPSVCWLMN